MGMGERSWSPNQVVAFNLRKARDRMEWTQAQAIEALRKHGLEWSRSTYALAEAFKDSDRGRSVRQFSADDLVILATTFGVPLAWFFLPPTDDDADPQIVAGDGADATQLDAYLLFRLIIDEGNEVYSERLAEVFRNADLSQLPDRATSLANAKAAQVRGIQEQHVDLFMRARKYAGELEQLLGQMLSDTPAEPSQAASMSDQALSQSVGGGLRDDVGEKRVEHVMEEGEKRRSEPIESDGSGEEDTA